MFVYLFSLYLHVLLFTSVLSHFLLYIHIDFFCFGFTKNISKVIFAKAADSGFLREIFPGLPGTV